MNLIITKEISLAKKIKQYITEKDCITTDIYNISNVISKQQITKLSIAIENNDCFIIEPIIESTRKINDIDIIFIEEKIKQLKNNYVYNNVSENCSYFSNIEKALLIERSDKVNIFLL